MKKLVFFLLLGMLIINIPQVNLAASTVSKMIRVEVPPGSLNLTCVAPAIEGQINFTYHQTAACNFDDIMIEVESISNCYTGIVRQTAINNFKLDATAVRLLRLQSTRYNFLTSLYNSADLNFTAITYSLMYRTNVNAVYRC